MAELTVYPDAGTGNTTVDGPVARYNTSGDSWADIRTGAGNLTEPTSSAVDCVRYRCDANTDKWDFMYRAIFTFDTSALGSGASISAADFCIYITGIDNSFTDSLAVVGATPANDNNLVDADYGQVGSTLYATAVALAGLSTSQYNNISLNATGLAAISKTGITKLGTRGEHDRSDSEPAWSSGADSDLDICYADYADVTSDPKLVITYTLGGSPYTLTADPGSFTLTGTAASLLWKQVLSASAGSFTQTGSAVTFLKGKTMAADAGSYTLTGTATDLLWKQILAADAGSYSLTGTAADLLHAQILDAAGGIFTFTGTAADLLQGYAIDADPGSFTLTGTAADLFYHRVFPVGSGAFTLTGTDATLLYAALFSGTAGVNTFTVGTLPVNLLSVTTLPDNDLVVTTLPANELDVTV